MASRDTIGIDGKAPPFDQFAQIRWIDPERNAHRSPEHVRHQLYVARPKSNPINVLIKVAAKPGAVYQKDLSNEISTLTTINEALPDSRYFPFLHDHGELDDGRVYLISSLFDEFPLATVVGHGHVASQLVGHLRTAIEIARALEEIHPLGIFHVDLNPMNILFTTRRNKPVIRIVDFESSYEQRRHGAGAFYNPPTTPGYSAPEIPQRVPDARSDVYSLAAVLETLLTGRLWAGSEPLNRRIARESWLDDELRDILLTAADPDRDRRHPSMEICRVALTDYLERIWPGRLS
jgi:serine/threonine protein kinase